MDGRWNPLTIGEVWEWARNKFNTGSSYISIMEAARHFKVSREVIFTRFWHLAVFDGLLRSVTTGKWVRR